MKVQIKLIVLYYIVLYYITNLESVLNLTSPEHHFVSEE